MCDLSLRESDNWHHSFSTEEHNLVGFDHNHVSALRTPLNWLVGGSFQSDEFLIGLAVLSLSFVEFVDSHIFAASEKVLLALQVKDGSSQVSHVSCSLGHLEFF